MVRENRLERYANEHGSNSAFWSATLWKNSVFEKFTLEEYFLLTFDNPESGPDKNWFNLLWAENIFNFMLNGYCLQIHLVPSCKTLMSHIVRGLQRKTTTKELASSLAQGCQVYNDYFKNRQVMSRKLRPFITPCVVGGQFDFPTTIALLNLLRQVNNNFPWKYNNFEPLLQKYYSYLATLVVGL